LTASSITRIEVLYDTFLRKWGDKKDFLCYIREFGAIKRNEGESISHFSKRLNKMYSKIPTEIKPTEAYTKITYVDWAGDLDQRRYKSGYVFNLFGGAVSWMSKKQYVVALSTIEAEYMAAIHASKEAVWLQRLCSSMGLVQGAIRIDCDS